jgi:glycosyltransferase involved in cell wall biosynthesis
MIVFVDYATSGSAGCYTDAYFEAGLSDNVTYFTSYYHRSKYARRIFFRYSDLAAGNVLRNFNFFRLCVRAIEYCLATLEIYYFIKKSRSSILIYALSRNTIFDDLAIFLYKKICRCKVIIIAHDVFPFGTNSKFYAKILQRRFKLFSLADELIVHSNGAKKSLEHFFSNSSIKIHNFPFPIFNLKDFLIEGQFFNNLVDKDYFLFIGHIREEKGIDLLLDSWSNSIEHHYLVIAGLWPKELYRKYESIIRENRSIILINNYLEDCDMVNLIRGSKCVVLPYKFGTNSGILSMCIGLGKHVLVSNILMFKDYFDYYNISVFNLKEPDTLSDKLLTIARQKDISEISVERGQEYFHLRKEVFSKLLIEFKQSHNLII